MEPKALLRVVGAYVFVPLSMLFSLGVSCDPSGNPTIDRFIIQYDIVSVLDATQGIEWDVKFVSSVDLSVRDESNTVVWSDSVPSGTSNGLHSVPVDDLEPGRYSVVLSASNPEGTTSDTRDFLLVGREGIWYRFTKRSRIPEEGPWFGFTEMIPVGSSQGLNHAEVISISEQVNFRAIRWAPNPLLWADRQGCTSPGLDVMGIRQLQNSYIFDKDIENPFPQPWTPVGQYFCTVDWSPCNFGWEGSERVYSDVEFYIELQAYGLQ